MNRRQRLFRPPTPETLAKAALHYLGRYAASEASLRRVLENRLRRAALRNREFAADREAQQQLRLSIENIVERHRKTGVLNDAAYAETKINSLRRAGRSARAIHQKLAHAGVEKAVIDGVLAGREDELSREDEEMKAAMALARRRRLGPFRKGKSDPAFHHKELATFARAGFSLDIARRVLGTQGLPGADDDVEGAGEDSASSAK